MDYRFKRIALVVVSCTMFATLCVGLPDLKQELERAREDVIRLTQAYTEELSVLLTYEETARTRAAEAVNSRRTLFEQGLISRVDLEDSERQLSDARRRVEQVKQQIEDAERTIDEVKLALEEDSRTPADSGIIRFTGKSPWSLQSVARIERFFENRFGETLPVSAYGQTPLHDRFGLAHQNAIDVAVHPDSPEGQGLIEFLRETGTSFIAFRSAVAGSATGAHIHIGPPSPRIRTAV